MKFLKKILLLSVLSLVLSVLAFTPKVHAATFDSGRIIDDAVFTNKSAMSVGDIQNFLNSKVPTCDTWHTAGPSAQGATPPWTCLKDYYENTSTGANNLNGAAIPAGSISAAQIIYNAAQTYSISPQVLIVTLQKENGLITDDWPYPWQYRTAMGFACPDNGSCDPAYYGFSKQVNQAARHFRNFYDQNPSWYIPYRPGVNYIQYNPNAGCGGTNVNIQNSATSALYSYTPYQPNAAALNNLYGTGDSCSAYGNRNFWRYFNDWFGSTIIPPYQWSIVSQGWSKDIANLPRGEKATLTLQARNIGTATWYKGGSNPVRLGASPGGRSSGFATSSWVNTQRPANMQEDSVAPGAVANFSFEIQANPGVGNYNEAFNLVAENITWFNDLGQYYPIRVITPTIAAQLVENTYQASMAASATANAVVKLKNTGNVSWYNTGSFSPDLYTYPYGRNSVFKSPSWPSSSIAARLTEASVAPGATGTFTFSEVAPSTTGSYVEQYRFGLTNLGWADLVVSQNITVTGGIPPQTKIPVYRHYNPSKGAHFYTTDLNESNIIRAQGWNYEGIAWNVSASTTTTPVYRHYNPSVGRHFYTTDLNESNIIRSQGWNYEGIAWYASSTATSIPIYRHYSPSRRAHFYTTDLNESNTIRSQGWSYEGIAYYAL